MNSNRESKWLLKTSFLKDSNNIIPGQMTEVSRMLMKTFRVTDGDGFY